MEKKLNVEELAIFCKKKGFVFQAAEIYGGLAGFFDFGPLGVELKINLKDSYWREFVHKRDDVVGQDGSIITNPKVWEASGHLESFGDLVLTTKESKTKLRADHFIEDELNISGDGLAAKDINELIKKHNLKYNGEDFEEVKDFNLLFPTKVGADENKKSVAYLRGETCQSIFPNFRSVAEVSRAKLPFGIAQIGKAFRNEISPRDFVFRCREFEQMEIEYFIDPETECSDLTDDLLNLEIQLLDAKTQENDSSETRKVKFEELKDKKYNCNSYQIFWIARFYKWLTENIGLSPENLRLREHMSKELSHYSVATFDIDYKYQMGFKELLGIANRTNFDLETHQKHSKTKMEFFDESSQKKILPHVIEPSIGVERLMMSVLIEGYNYDKERGNVVLKMKPTLAPNQVAIFPLMKKPELVEVARKIHETLLDENITSFYDEKGSVGKRYARQDEIGTPYCITVDYEALENDTKDTVTIRDRDSTEQKRVKIEKLPEIIRSLIRGREKFSEL